jgi:type II secretory pathway predicted ATPase ExeA
MYETFFGLRERPFDITADARFLCLTSGHRDAVSSLEYGIAARRGLMVLTGEAGVGKTTLLNAVLNASWQHNIRTLYLCNPTLSRATFIEFLAQNFELSHEAHTSAAAFVTELVPVLLRRHQAGGTTVLVLDEAQELPQDLLEEVRLLANIEADASKLLQVVLAGEPDFEARLDESSLRPLRQRIALRCDLKPFDASETAAFIAERIRIAGGDVSGMFSDCAFRAIHRHSRGIPRTICVVCDTALVTAFAQDCRLIDGAAVNQLCRDIALSPLSAARSPVHPRVNRRPHRTDVRDVRFFESAIESARQPEPAVAADRTLSATVARSPRRRSGHSRRQP